MELTIGWRARGESKPSIDNRASLIECVPGGWDGRNPALKAGKELRCDQYSVDYLGIGVDRRGRLSSAVAIVAGALVRLSDMSSKTWRILAARGAPESKTLI